MSDSAMELAAYTAQRHDRTANAGKKTGGGLCIYVNNNCCTNTVIVDSHCSPNLEYMTVMLNAGHFIPPESLLLPWRLLFIFHRKQMLTWLLDCYMAALAAKWANILTVYIVAGDFNHADLKVALPKLHQLVKWATIGANTLDKVYTNIKLGYRAKQCLAICPCF